MIKDLRAMNAQIYGTLFASAGVISGDVTIEGSFIGNDYLSANWESGGGTVPVDLSSVDTGATVGFAWDSSEGSAQLMGDMFVGGDIIVGDINGIFTQLRGGTGVIQFDDQSDVAGPDNAAYIIPGAVDEGDIGGGNHAWRADLLFYGMEWTAGGALPWMRMTSMNQYNPSEPFTQWGFGSSSSVWLHLDGEGFIDSKKEHYFSDRTYHYTGTVAAPSMSFSVDTNTGWYRVGENNPSVAAGGYRIQDWYLNGNNPQARFVDGSGAFPSMTFITDSDMGFYKYGTNVLGIATGGALAMRLGPNYVASPYIYASTHGAAANMTVQTSGSGFMYRSTASSRRLKHNIKPLTDPPIVHAKMFQYNPGHLIDDPEGTGIHYGFIAEDVRDAFGDNSVTFDEDGEVDDYNWKHVMATLEARIYTLERKLQNGIH
jgi:hypothetical protein